MSAPDTTYLGPDLERAFQYWAQQNGIRDVDHPDSHYDYRGFFLATMGAPRPQGHMTDVFKQHGHPSFSVESQYSRGPQDGVTWLGSGDDWVPIQPAMSSHAPATMGELLRTAKGPRR